MKRSRLKLLPVTMLVAFLALGLKLGEVMHDGHEMLVTLSNTAQAETAADPNAKKPEDAAKPTGDAAKAAATTDKGKPAEGDAKPPANSDEKPPEGEEERKAKREYSQIEVDLLQSLAQRRQELDNWSKQVQLKENMLIATEQRINEKIDSLQRMKKEIEDLLALYNEQEDTKIRSLVKIYENMKPKDAARIFEELDMPVLLIVVDKMSERKVSPILANMSPQKAKDLTVQLAEQRKLQKPRANAAAAAAENAAQPENAANGAQNGASAGTGGTGASPPATGNGNTEAATGAASTPPAASPEAAAKPSAER